MKEYYNQRAPEYERIYAIPERQEDLEILRQQLKSRFRDHSVLEVACGTGYWTSVIATSAKSVLASDQSPETLAIAGEKNLANVTFMMDDAYQLAGAQGEFSAGFAGFWWSHVPKSRQQEFLAKFHAKLQPGATVVMIDNQFVESSTPIRRSDSEGNTFQMRKLSDGSEHEVLKNFPSDGEFHAVFPNAEIVRLKYYWLLQYRKP